MEKTIKCADCDIEFTFEENPRFPRKYCLNCGAASKKRFEQGTNGDEKPEVVKFTADGKETGWTEKAKPKDNGFHLTPEQVRSNALASAIEHAGEIAYKLDKKTILNNAKDFEQYILTGK